MQKERFSIRAAVYLILLKGDHILLSRRFNTGWKDGSYSLISGHLDGNESVSDSMIREAEEEAGIKISKDDLHPATVTHRRSPDQEYMDFFFVSKKWAGEATIKEKDKCDDLSWFPINSLPSNLLPHVSDAIKNYQYKVPFFESGWN